jgi:hypothetical protein
VAVVALIIGLLAPVGVLAGPAGAAPAAPVLTAPTDGATVTANPVLAWDALPDAVRYEVQVATDPSFAPAGVIRFQQTTANTRATPPSDLAVGTYYWRVRGIDAASAAGPYTTRSFQKVAADSPTPLAPADGATIQYPAPVVLSWAAMAGMDEYLVQVDDDPNFIGAPAATVTPNTSFTTVTPSALGTTQYWRVQGRSATGVLTQQSPVRSYTLVWSAAPTLVGPPSTFDIPVEEIVLDWSPLNGAQSYELQVSADIEFNVPIGGTRLVESTTFAPNPTFPAGSYYWRVRGLTTTDQPGPWSSIGTFSRAWPGQNTLTFPNGITSDAFRQVDLLSPADDDFSLSQPTLSWTPQREASHYEVQWSTDVNFSPGTFSTCETNRTTWTPYARVTGPGTCNQAPTPGVVWNWRVRAVDATSNVLGVFSPVRQFLFDTPLVVQTAPADEATVSVPVLRWTAVPNINRYRVTLQATGCATITVTVATTVWVPETLDPSCVGPISWFVRTVDDNGNLSRDVSSAFWPTFSIGTPLTPQADLDPVVEEDIGGFRPPLMTWNPLTGATYYRVWASIAGSNTYFRLHNRTNQPAFGYAAVGQENFDDLLPAGDYEYYVEAFNASMVSLGVSDIGSFHIDPLAPAVMTGPAHCPPAGGCSPLHDTPTFTWESVPGAGSYLVYLATDPNFTNITRTWSTRYTHLTPTESLPDSQAGQATYWFVRPCAGDTCGPFDPSVFPQARAFQKQSFPIQPLGPLAGTVVTTGEVTFRWTDYLVTNQALDGAFGENVTQEARNYRVQVSTDAGFTAIIDTSPFVDQTTYTAQSTTYPDGPLFWRVQAFDNSNNPLTFSAAIQFTKASGVPSLQLPADGATVNGAPVLTWAPMPYTETYDIEVYRNVGVPLTLANRVANITTRSTAAIANLNLPVGTYGWRARRVDINGEEGAWTSPGNANLRLFSVTGPAATLIAPADGATVETAPVLLTWTGVPGASQYRVEVSTVSNFVPILESFTTEGTNFAPNMLNPLWPNATLYWRVHTLDSAGNVIATSAVRSLVKDTSTMGEFTAITPVRLHDTRLTTAIGNNQVRTLDLTDVNDINGVAGPLPAAGVSAVALNVTVTGPTQAGWVTVYPANASQPLASNLNFVAGQTIANSVVVGVDSNGRIRVHNARGVTHVIIDVVGYYSDGTLPRATRYNGAVSPTRILDTRGGPSIPSEPLTHNETRIIDVAGEAGVPLDATAVVLNVTAVLPSEAGWFTVFPNGASMPATSSLNFAPGGVVPNLVTVAIGTGGDIKLNNARGTTHAVIDVIGWFEAGNPADGARFNAVTPARLLDSRPSSIFSAGETRALQIRGQGGVPNSSTVSAVVLNVTVDQPAGSGWITVFPTGTTLPLASNLNYVAGQVVPNLVVATVGSDGRINIFASERTHVIVDVVGWYSD